MLFHFIRNNWSYHFIMFKLGNLSNPRRSHVIWCTILDLIRDNPLLCNNCHKLEHRRLCAIHIHMNQNEKKNWMNKSSWKIIKLLNHNAHVDIHRFLYKIKFLEGSFLPQIFKFRYYQIKNEGGSSIIKRPMKTSDIA